MIATVTEAVGNGTTDINATLDTMGATSSSQRPGSYNASQDSHNAKRLKALALGNAVIGNRNEKSGAPDDITPTKKGLTGKSGDMDFSSVCWMQLILERDPQKPVTLTELKKRGSDRYSRLFVVSTIRTSPPWRIGICAS